MVAGRKSPYCQPVGSGSVQVVCKSANAPQWSQVGHDGQHTGRSPYRGTVHGLPLWTFSSGDVLLSSPVVGVNGTVYIRTSLLLLALNGENGTQVWNVSLPSEVNSTPAIAPDGTIYVTTVTDGVWALRPDGELKWTWNPGQLDCGLRIR